MDYVKRLLDALCTSYESSLGFDLGDRTIIGHYQILDLTHDMGFIYYYLEKYLEDDFKNKNQIRKEIYKDELLERTKMLYSLSLDYYGPIVKTEDFDPADYFEETKSFISRIKKFISSNLLKDENSNQLSIRALGVAFFIEIQIGSIQIQTTMNNENNLRIVQGEVYADRLYEYVSDCEREPERSALNGFSEFQTKARTNETKLFKKQYRKMMLDHFSSNQKAIDFINKYSH